MPIDNTAALTATAHALVADGKGLLAMDESNGTCNRRFAAAGIAQTEAMRRAWRELLLTAPGLCDSISGVILYDETLHQATDQGLPFVTVARDAGLIVGIKVDIGTKPLAAHPGEQVTEGLDGLRERLQAYAAMGARFAKWRGVVMADEPGMVTASRPSRASIVTNALALARYAALCQEAGLVPVVEPEVLMDGRHTLQRCQAVTEALLRSVFEQLALQGVLLEAMLLKPNMVLPGLDCAVQQDDAAVAAATLQTLLRVVPAAVPGIVFLSGGQSPEQASRRLNAMHQTHPAASPTSPPPDPAAPWPLSFSFARALQQPALTLWSGQDAQRAAAQQALLHRARCNRAAVQGHYSAAMEAT